MVILKACRLGHWWSRHSYPLPCPDVDKTNAVTGRAGSAGMTPPSGCPCGLLAKLVVGTSPLTPLPYLDVDAEDVEKEDSFLRVAEENVRLVGGDYFLSG